MEQFAVQARESDFADDSRENWLSGTKLYSCLFVGLFLFLYIFPAMVILVPAGHAGVLYRPLHGGTYMAGGISEGLTVISPINSLTVYDLRLQEYEEKVDVLSSNGLTIVVSVSFRFAPMRSELPRLHVLIGQDYAKKIVIPTVISSVREMVGKYLPEELYTTHRNTVQEEMNRDIRERLVGKHIHFEAILIRSINLPELINAAIENKLRQQQEFQEYEYRLRREAQEAERKRIEAAGWRDFQATVSENLTPGFLRWKWIDSMLALSKSGNAKVVVLGEGEEGKLPVSLPMVMEPLPVTVSATPAASNPVPPAQPEKAGSSRDLPPGNQPPMPGANSESAAFSAQFSAPPAVAPVAPVPAPGNSASVR